MSSGSSSLCSFSSKGANVPCHCGLRSTIVSSWKARSFGRRFCGCSKYWAGESCNYFEWVDPPTCEYGVEFGKKVMRRLEKLEHQLVVEKDNHKERVNKIERELRAAEERGKVLESVCESIALREKIWRRMLYLCCLIIIVMILFYVHHSKGKMYRLGYPCLGEGNSRFV